MAEGRLKAYAAAAAVFALDRLTKWIIERGSPKARYRVIPGFFDIVHSENRGVAFGMINDSAFEWRTWR
jgi:lipoprotein signal peptidase